MSVNKETNESGNEIPRVVVSDSTDINQSDCGHDGSYYHPLAAVADLLVALRDENQNNEHKNNKQQYTNMEFVDKKTGEIQTQRVIF